jgi:plastocyanin domain-containing protein
LKRPHCNEEDEAMTRGILVGTMAMLLVGVTATASEPAKKAAARRIDISITEAGFEPDNVTVKAGEEVTLAFTRKTDQTCATEVVLFVNDKDKVEKKLPLNEVVPVDVKFSKTGKISYACGMNMYKGVIVVQ